MRMLALPASLALAFLLYLPLPALADRLDGALAWLYARTLRLFTDKRGRHERALALASYLLLLGGVPTLLGALHPVLCALTAAPLFSALSRLPRAASVKRELDGGALKSDAAAYEARVLAVCEGFASAFSREMILPLLLLALGMPLGLGGALGFMARGLRAADAQSPLARRVLPPLERAADAVFHALLLLCSCVVGRNPFRTRGKDVRARLLSVLGLDGTASGHAPVAGDIAQAAFLCGFASCVLCAMLTLLLLPFGL